MRCSTARPWTRSCYFCAARKRTPGTSTTPRASQRGTPARIAITAIKVLIGGALIAILAAVAYQSFVERYAGLQPHENDPPGIHQPRVPP